MLTHILRVTFLASHNAAKLIIPLAALAFSVFAQTKPAEGIRPLTLGHPIEREMKGEEAHSYNLALQAGQFLSVIVEQKGIDVAVTLLDPSGNKLTEIDSPNGTHGPEPLSVIVKSSGNYHLKVSSMEKAAPKGFYELKMLELRPSTANDRTNIAAIQLYNEAELLKGRNDEASLRKSIEKFEEALREFQKTENKTWEAKTLSEMALSFYELSEYRKALELFIRVLPMQRAAGDRKSEASALNNMGRLYDLLGEKQKALEFLKQAHPIRLEVGDRRGEAATLSNIGLLYSSVGEKQNALEYLNKALLIRREISDRSGEAETLNSIGSVYHELGEMKKALEYLNTALLIQQKDKDPEGEAKTLNNIARVYDDFGEKRKALEFYDLALPILRLAGDRGGEATVLSNMALIYSDLGEMQTALEYLNRTLPIDRAIGDPRGEATTLTNIGFIYSVLGEKMKALEYYTLALPIRRSVNDRDGEAVTLNNIGFIYASLGEKKKAVEYYGQALPVLREVGNRKGEANIFTNMGSLHLSLGETQKALEYHNLALPIRRAIDDRGGEAVTLNNIGRVYDSLGDRRKGLEYYSQALPLLRAVGDRRGEAIAFENIAVAHKALGNSRLTISLLKQAAVRYQELRQAINRLDTNVQKTYLRSIEKAHSTLAEALIVGGRLAEAQQILNSFKDQQYFDFDSNVQIALPALTPRETASIAEFHLNVEAVVSGIRRIDEFKRGISDRAPTSAEASEIKVLEAGLQTANDKYQSFLKMAEQQFGSPPDERDKIGSLPDTRDMQTGLRDLAASTGQNAVAVYQLVGDENFQAVIVTRDSIKSVSTPIKAAVLNERAKQFWALLQTDKYDTTRLGKQLYDTVFKPIEKELPKGTKTILWSLDGNLRYVPMAALHDGKQFLVERFNHVTFTRADKERMTRGVQPNWTATAFGSAKEQTVDLLGTKIPFSALPGVNDEMSALFRQKDKKSGIFEGEALLDAKFTRDAMLAALKQKRPVVHIASHFSFRPGDEARSFLLMGDGTAFTLDEMKKHTDMFAGVDLLTLSACNTGAQQADANGREVDAFFELAQRLGANSVMATLWSVADNSTPWLMREFYKGKAEKRFTKAESLRRAQLALLKGNSDAVANTRDRNDSANSKANLVVVTKDGKRDTNTRADEFVVSEAQAPPFKKDPKRPFAHPFYWSPFVLIGNWR